MSAYISNVLIANADFENKLNNLKIRLKSRMNGQTTEQMQNGQIDYALNYGVSLQHVQELAAELDYTPTECTLLWQLNIREAMLIAAIKMPTQCATPAEMMRWIPFIKTPDMVEQSVFFLFWRVTDIDIFLTLLLQSDAQFALSVAFFAAGKALQKQRSIATQTLNMLTNAIANKTQWSQPEARGASLLLRQIGQTKAFAAEVKRIISTMKQSANQLQEQIAFEVDMAIF